MWRDQNFTSLESISALNSTQSRLIPPASGHGAVFPVHILLLPMRVRLRAATETAVEGPKGIARAAECRSRSAA
jgi:hypothetical protein